MGMLIPLQALWAYFLTQKSPPNDIQFLVKQHKCVLQRIDSLRRERDLQGMSEYGFLILTWLKLPSSSTVKKTSHRAVFLASLPTPHTLRALPVQDKMSGISCGSYRETKVCILPTKLPMSIRRQNITFRLHSWRQSSD